MVRMWFGTQVHRGSKPRSTLTVPVFWGLEDVVEEEEFAMLERWPSERICVDWREAPAKDTSTFRFGNCGVVHWMTLEEQFLREDPTKQKYIIPAAGEKSLAGFFESSIQEAGD